MPVEKIVREEGRTWALWKVTEEENAFRDQLNFNELIPESITNPRKRLEWFAGRVLVKEMLRSMNLTFHGIVKDEFGKPFLKDHSYQLSLSHSFPYVAALIDDSTSAGIDLEQPKTKLLTIAPRVLHPEELNDAGDDLTKHCVYWCAKEALIKVHGKKDLTLAENLLIAPFLLGKEGDLVGRIIERGIERIIPLQYLVTPDFVLVLSKRF